MTFYEKITGMQGSVEQWLRRTPVIKDYLQQGDWRAADRLVREKLARQLETQLTEFVHIQAVLASKGDMKSMGRLRGVGDEVRILLDGIASAAGGYTGVFDPVKVDQEALARVYGFDEGLFKYVDQFATGVKSLGDAVQGEDIESVLSQFESLTREMRAVWAQRLETLRGL